jgi:hypothetical protein
VSVRCALAFPFENAYLVGNQPKAWYPDMVLGKSSAHAFEAFNSNNYRSFYFHFIFRSRVHLNEQRLNQRPVKFLVTERQPIIKKAS